MSTPQTGMPAPSSAPQATMREFFAVIFRRRWLIIGLFLTVTATVMVIAFSTPTRFESSGRVLVTRGERESALTGRVQLLNDWEADLASEVAKVHSTPVLRRAQEKLETNARGSGHPAPTIDRTGVDVEVLGKSNVLAIGYSDLNPAVAQQVCDALIRAYVELRQAKETIESDTLFASELASIDRQIDARLAERKAIAGRAGVTNAQDQSRAWLSEMAYLEQRRDDEKAQLASAQASLREMRELMDNPNVDLPTSDTQFTSENALRTLKDRITQQQANIATLRERYRDDSPEIQSAMSTLETLQALLRKEVNARVLLMKGRTDVLQAQVDAISQSVADLRARLDHLPGDQNALEDVEAAIKTLRDRHDEFVKARDQAHITANVSSGVMIQLLNPAGPATPKNTLDLVRLGLAPAFSLVVGIGLAFFIDGLDLTVRTAGQAEEYLEVPVLATLPDRRSRRG
jgi:succinoglycan biosynthesis transport protein ExoP